MHTTMRTEQFRKIKTSTILYHNIHIRRRKYIKYNDKKEFSLCDLFKKTVTTKKLQKYPNNLIVSDEHPLKCVGQ